MKGNNVMKCWMLTLTVILALAWGAGRTMAQEASNGSSEDIFFMEIPIVVSASKREQPLTEAASTVNVITGEEIRESGAMDIAEALRLIPGLDVRTAHASQHVLGIRGFVDTAHVLVTIDGNNAFMYHANHIFTDWMPLDIEEIDRIEVIKGPGAVFYGGNAFSGVINIITKTPEQLRGTQVNLQSWADDAYRYNLIHAGSVGDLDYSIALGMRGAEEWTSADILPQEEDEYSMRYAALRLIYHIEPTRSISLGARYSDAENVISRLCNPTTTFVFARYDQRDFWARVFYNGHRKDFWDHTYGVDDRNSEVELYKTLRRGKNTISLGAYAKHTQWKVSTLEDVTDLDGNPVPKGTSETHSVDDFAVNIENEHRYTEKLLFVLGGRGEYYSALDYIGLGRASLIYLLSPEQSLRITWANGYSLPSLFQHTNEGTAYPFALGNEDLVEEKIESYELAYFGNLWNRLTLRASMFYNEYRDLIDNTQLGPAENTADAQQIGGELSLDYQLTKWLDVFASYAWQETEHGDFKDYTVDPEHKINAGMRLHHGRLHGMLAAYHVSAYDEIYLTSNPVFGRVMNADTGEAQPAHVDSYMIVDARVAFRPVDNLEVFVAGSNIFNDEHYESNPPNGNAGNWHTGDRIGRLITLGVSLSL